MPDHIYYQAHEAYFIDLNWSLLIPIHILRPDLFLFFSSNSSLPPQSSLLNLALLFVVAAVFLTVSLNIYIHPSDGSLISICRLKCKDKISYLLCGALLFSLLCPSSVFQYSYFFILLLSICPSFKMQELFCYIHSYIMMVNIPNQPLQPEPEPEWNLLDHTLQTLYYYELRWILSILVNRFLRPYFSLFFSDFIITSPHNFLKNFILISIVSILYLFMSIKICLIEDDNGLLFIILRLDYRDGRSPLIAIVFIFSILCPTPFFLYTIPWIPFLGLWPSVSLHILRGLLLRAKAAVTAFLACGAPVIPTPSEPDEPAEFV